MNTQLTSTVLLLCLSKVEGVIIRVIDFVRWIPLRLWRIGMHLWAPIHGVYKNPRDVFKFSNYFYWVVELIFLVGDLLGLGEIHETLADIIKFNTRPLDVHEKQLVRKIFGNKLNIRRLRIDEFAFGGPKTHQFAYVSFYTINHWGDLSEDVLVHELVHVWQYHQLGSVYIPRALRAQFSSEGYDYGGLASLVMAIRSGKKLIDFNLEQQGDIIADYYRILKGEDPRWGATTKEDLWVYEHILSDLKSKKESLAA